MQVIQALSLAAGDVCVFKTSPFNRFSAPDTGRYGVLKVLSAGEMVIYVVLDGVFSQPPELRHAAALPPLYQERFSFSGTPALCSMPRGWDIDLLEFALLGNVPVSEAELALIPRFPPMGPWGGASTDAEGEWRWRHDREALKLEVARRVAAQQEEREAERRRYETRLKHLTWTTLLEEVMFEGWTPSPPFPPPDFIDAVRRAFHSAIIELQGLGAKPRKKDTRRILRTLVGQINALDERHGQVVETEEREDLCAAIEELAFVARHRRLAEEASLWRSW